MTGPTPILEARAVTFGFRERPDFLGPLDLSVHAGQCWGIIGPNGAGKTTLLRLLAGLARPRSGEVWLDGQDISGIGWRQRARRVAYLPQKVIGDPDASALETVLMGRFPYRSYGLFESQEDHRIARRSMEATETWPLADRALSTLSGGEAQRVHLAATLAQSPHVFLLDEPTSALDLSHQLTVMGLLRNLSGDCGAATVVVTHDLNLAGHYCDHIALMAAGGIVAAGPSDEVLAPERLESVYAVKFTRVSAAERGPGWILPQRQYLNRPCG